MAEIFQDLLCNRDDYLRALRALLREIMRAVRQDMNFPEFALGLMQERSEDKFRDMDPQLKVSVTLVFQPLTDVSEFSSGISKTFLHGRTGERRHLGG